MKTDWKVGDKCAFKEEGCFGDKIYVEIVEIYKEGNCLIKEVGTEYHRMAHFNKLEELMK